MNNKLITEHPSEDVQAATIRLLDALCMWERSTGRHHILIVKDSIGVDYRSFDSAPVNDMTSDAVLLEMFDNVVNMEKRGTLGEGKAGE